MTLLEPSTTSLGLDRLHFDRGIPGFEALTEFSCECWGGEGSPYTLLTATDRPDVQFVVVSPSVFFPRYRPSVPAVLVQMLGLKGPDDAHLEVILTLGRRPEEATANLLAPLVVNHATARAVQAVLGGPDWTVRVPLTDADFAG
jgi:flagellar assembly factor FliW